MEDKIAALEERFETLASNLDKRLEIITEKLSGNCAPGQRQQQEREPNQASETAPDQAQAETPPPRRDEPTSGSPSAHAGPDVQGEFAAVRECYQRVKLPSDLRLSESRTGIRREDQSAFNIASRSARYVETTLKILSLIDRQEDSNRDIDNLFTVSLAHMRYLQDEYSSLVVQGSFDHTTSRLFRQLQRQTSGLTGEAVENLHRAAGLAAVVNRAPNNSSSARGRGGSRGFSRGRGRGRFSPNDRAGGGSSDFFYRYAPRQPFPTQSTDRD